jgi:hypothetical protein
MIFMFTLESLAALFSTALMDELFMETIDVSDVAIFECEQLVSVVLQDYSKGFFVRPVWDSRAISNASTCSRRKRTDLPRRI